MSTWTGKVEDQNEESKIDLVTHDLQDCLDESLDFNFNNVYASSYDEIEENNENSNPQKPASYIKKIEHQEENVG